MAAVTDALLGVQHQFPFATSARVLPGHGGGSGGIGRERHRGVRVGVRLIHTVVQARLPHRDKGRQGGGIGTGGQGPLPGRLDQVMIIARAAGPAHEALLPLARIEQRADHRLAERIPAHLGHVVVPGLQVVVVRAHPLAQAGGLVRMGAHAHGQRDLLQAGLALGGVGQAVGRVGPGDQQGAHLAGVHVLHQLGHRCVIALEEPGVVVQVDGAAIGAEQVVDAVHHHLHGLVVAAAEHQGLALGRP